MFYSFKFSASIIFNIKSLIETNENKSNELSFSDVYLSLNYIGTLATANILENWDPLYITVIVLKLNFFHFFQCNNDRSSWGCLIWVCTIFFII